MKKVLFLLAISSLGFVACNNSADGNSTEDSTAMSDSTVIDPTVGNPPVNPTDTMVNVDTTTAPTDTSLHQ